MIFLLDHNKKFKYYYHRYNGTKNRDVKPPLPLIPIKTIKNLY